MCSYALIISGSKLALQFVIRVAMHIVWETSQLGILRNYFEARNPLQFQLCVIFSGDAFIIGCHVVATQDLVSDWILAGMQLYRKKIQRTICFFTSYLWEDYAIRRVYLDSVEHTEVQVDDHLTPCDQVYILKQPLLSNSKKGKHIVSTFLSVQTHMSHAWWYGNWFSAFFKFFFSFPPPSFFPRQLFSRMLFWMSVFALLSVK